MSNTSCEHHERPPNEVTGGPHRVTTLAKINKKPFWDTLILHVIYFIIQIEYFRGNLTHTLPLVDVQPVLLFNLNVFIQLYAYLAGHPQCQKPARQQLLQIETFQGDLNGGCSRS